MTGRSRPSPILTSSIAAAESEWIDTEPRSNGIREPLGHVERVGDAEDARLERERLPVGAVADDRLQGLRHDDGALGLVVDAVEELAELRLRQEEAEVLVVLAMDRHPDVVEEGGEHDHDLGVGAVIR